MMGQDLLTAQEAADLLKVKKATVYEMVKRGQIPAVKIGKQVRIARGDLERMLTPPGQSAAPGGQELSRTGVVLCGQDSCCLLYTSRCV